MHCHQLLPAEIEPHCIQLTVGSILIKYSGEVSTPTADTTTHDAGCIRTGWLVAGLYGSATSSFHFGVQHLISCALSCVVVWFRLDQERQTFLRISSWDEGANLDAL